MRPGLLTLPLTANAHAENLLTNGDLETGATTGWQILNPTNQPVTWGITMIRPRSIAAKTH